MNPFCACIRCKAHRAVQRVADARLMALGGFWAARIWVRDFLIHVPAPEPQTLQETLRLANDSLIRNFRIHPCNLKGCSVEGDVIHGPDCPDRQPEARRARG